MPALLPALAVVTASACLTVALILALRPLLVRYVIAEPNMRSSHAVATPQGAGLAVMLALLVTCAAAAAFFPGAANGFRLFPVLAAAAGLSVLGLADDAKALPVSGRLFGQALAALAVVLSLPEGFRILPDLLPLLVERSLLVLGIVWFVNAVNFLDGIDLITVAQTLPISIGVAVLALVGVVPGTVGLLALALTGGMLGFAVFNKHPARVFLGDAGSLPVGLCLAFMLIVVAQVSVAAALLFALYTLADSTLTLGRRALAREALLTAHRSHFYQRAVISGMRVPDVSGRVFLLGLVLAGLAIAAALVPSALLSLALLASGMLATCLVLMSFARRRR